MQIEISARALLAIRLAPIPHAPPRTVRALAFDEAIEVARPILIHSAVLDEPTLVENAKRMGQDHLLAISRRRVVSEAITDVLVARGDQQVVLSTVGNRGAKFSGAGFEILVRRSNGDDSLSACVGSRPDIPQHLFRKLLAWASQHVRAKLEAEHPHARRAVNQVVDEVTNRIEAEAFTKTPDHPGVVAPVGALHRSSKLNDNALGAMAENGQSDDTITALATMCQLPLHSVERMVRQGPAESVLVVARAIGLTWSTVKGILLFRATDRKMSQGEIARCLANFERLRPATAREILHFYQARERPEKKAKLRTRAPSGHL